MCQVCERKKRKRIDPMEVKWKRLSLNWHPVAFYLSIPRVWFQITNPNPGMDHHNMLPSRVCLSFLSSWQLKLTNGSRSSPSHSIPKQINIGQPFRGEEGRKQMKKRNERGKKSTKHQEMGANRPGSMGAGTHRLLPPPLT